MSFAAQGADPLRDDVIARWADLLVDYCLRVERGETIVIGSELEARPLVEAAGKAVILRGAHPLVRLEIPGLHEFFLEHADDAQLAHLPPSAIAEAESIDARIRIAAESDTHSMSRVDPRRQAAFERTRDPIRRAVRQKRWVLTQYPTAAYAADAGMTLADYEAFVQCGVVPRPGRPRQRPGRSWAAARRGWWSSCRRSDRSGSRPTAPT